MGIFWKQIKINMKNTDQLYELVDDDQDTINSLNKIILW